MDETIKKLYQEGKNQTDIAKSIGKSRNYVRDRLIKWGLNTGWKIEDLSGNQYGDFTVIEFDKRNKHHTQLWKCKCKCGKVQSIQKSTLLFRKAACRDCSNKRLRRSNGEWYGEISSAYLSNVRRAAKYRKIPFDLSLKDVWDLYIKQNRKCALSGQNIEFKSKHSDKEKTASIDRIDSSKGYVIDNIHIVHKKLNVMKMDLSLDEFVQNCVLVSKFFNKGN